MDQRQCVSCLTVALLPPSCLAVALWLSSCLTVALIFRAKIPEIAVVYLTNHLFSSILASFA